MKIEITYRLDKEEMTDDEYNDQDDKVVVLETRDIIAIIATVTGERTHNICTETISAKIVN